MPLTGTAVHNARPGEKLIKLSDGGGLHLLIQPHGVVGDKQGYLNLKGSYEFDAALQAGGMEFVAYVRNLAGDGRNAAAAE